MSRYARKRDTNERDIIDALRNAGCMVIQENNVDLWVLPPHLPYWVPMEVKTKTGKLTEYQQRLHTSMADDYNYKIAIVTTIDEALEAAELR
jgi:phage gpG-like protein